MTPFRPVLPHNHPWANAWGVLILLLSLAASSAHAEEEIESWETLNTAGMLAYKEQNLLMAKALFHRAIESIGDPTEPDPRVATSLNNLGAVHEALGEYEQAELRYQHALTMIETIQGPEHPDVATGLNNLASLYFSQRAFAQAEPLWQRGLSISENLLGTDHPHLVRILVILGRTSQAQKKFDQAETCYTRAIRITEHAMGADHLRLIPLYERYATLLRQTHREEEADAVDLRIENIRATNPPATPSQYTREGNGEGTHTPAALADEP